MTKVAIIYYSTYGHIATMTEAVKKGIEAAGVTCDVFQVPETLPEKVLAKMGAPPKKEDPIITADMLVEYDGFIFGCSGRYGTFPAQMKVCTKLSGRNRESEMIISIGLNHRILSLGRTD
jgi:NAD(P)H dehydrogenase (quinone)